MPFLASQMNNRFRRSVLKKERSSQSLNFKEESLDPIFYRALYQDLVKHDDQAAALHWTTYGKKERRLQNANAALLADKAFDRLPADFNAVAYLYRNKDLVSSFFNVTAAIWHYLDEGHSEQRAYQSDSFDADFQAAYIRRWPGPPGIDPRLQWIPPNAAHYLHLKGLTELFLAEFDYQYYASFAFGEGRMLADRSECIIDFCELGLSQLKPIAEKMRYDVSFHRRMLRSEDPSSANLSDVDLYSKWLSEYDFHRYPANHVRYMEQHFGVACVGLQIAELGAYKLANADLRRFDSQSLLEHIFTDGLLEARTSIKISCANATFFARYAGHLELNGQINRADTVYQRLIFSVPNHPWINQQYGDFLYRRRRFTDAYRCYRNNIEVGAASKWTYLNAASCCVELNDFRKSLHIMEMACRVFPDDQHMLRERGSAAARFFADEFGYAKALAGSGKIEAAQSLAYDAAATYDFPSQSVAPGRPVQTVALFANLDLSQCNLYRVEQKSEQLSAAGYDVKVFEWNYDIKAFHDELVEFDAVIFFRVAAFPEVVRAIHAARAAGLIVFYEVDDLIFDAKEFPGTYENYAGQITSEQYVDICMGVPLFRYALQLCDFAIASTPSLAARMEPLVRRRRAFVHRNALGLRHEAAVSAHNEAHVDALEATTIFYGSGTKAHKLDFELVLVPALQEIGRRFGDKVRIVIAGHRPTGVHSDALLGFEFVPFTKDTESYWTLLSKADICLSVLSRSPVTSAKSEIKWLEAAMFGLPSVVSATDTFEEVVEDGEDGFLAENTADFVEKLSLLVKDPARRRAMGDAARKKALRDYSLPAMSANLREIFNSVEIARKERLRILVVNVFYAPQSKGGATRVVIDNIRDIRALYPDEFEFEVFTTCEGALDPYSVQVYSNEGVRTTAMVAGNYPEVDFTSYDARSGELFARCVKRFAPQLIHFHCIQRITTSAVEVARSLAIPYVITAHDGWWISDRQFLFDEKGLAPRYNFNRPAPFQAGSKIRNNRPREMLTALKGAVAVLAVSNAFAEIYRETGLENVRSVPNGLPSIGFDAASRAALRSGSPRNKVCLAHIGGLEQHKGFPMLKLAVVAANPCNVSLLAVDLSLEPGEERCELWGSTPVRIIARSKQEEMAALYAEIDVLFAPSLWPESFGLVTREALAAGCWVVASNRGAVGEPIQEGLNGHVVSVDDLKDLVETIRRIDDDPARYLCAPPSSFPMRTSKDQARDLVAIYREETVFHNDAYSMREAAC